MRLCYSLAVLFLFAVGLSSCAHHGHHGHHKKRMKHLWEKMDADKDGKISKQEYDAMHAETFAKMDANNDGFITPEEKKSHWKHKMHKKCEKCSTGKACDKKCSKAAKRY